MTTEQDTLTDLISRYKAWLLRDIPNPYYKSKFEWVESVKAKIKELESKIKTIKIK